MRWAALSLALFLTGCQFHVIHHDEDRAAAEAAAVLKLIYLDGNYGAAHQRLDPDLRPRTTPDQLAQLATHVSTAYGRVTELRLDSFLPMPGQRGMIIFFKGINEHGATFHRVTMVGDASGYRVAGFFFRSIPYPEERLRQRFAHPVVVVRRPDAA